MLPALPFAQYRFLFQATDPVSLPAFADPLWRSVFGLALHRLTCIGGGRDCRSCGLHSRCAFFLLTRSGLAPSHDESGLAASMRDLPVPLIFHSQVRDFTLRVPAGATFAARLVLVGSGNDLLEAVIRAMALAGDLGLGRRRARFRLQEVSCCGPQSLSVLIKTDQVQSPPVSGEPVPPMPARLRITLATPWLLADTPKNRSMDTPEKLAALLLMQIVRRVSLMQQCYTPAPLDCDFRDLKEQAGRISLCEVDITGRQSYAPGKGKKKFIAVRGTFILDMTGSEAIWPFLWLGRHLHAGKQAAHGYGRYFLNGIDPIQRKSIPSLTQHERTFHEAT